MTVVKIKSIKELEQELKKKKESGQTIKKPSK